VTSADWLQFPMAASHEEPSHSVGNNFSIASDTKLIKKRNISNGDGKQVSSQQQVKTV
jgi:hypothetical protein